jgi:hypothetical protein
VLLSCPRFGLGFQARGVEAVEAVEASLDFAPSTPASPDDRTSDLDHALAAILAGQQPDQRRGRIFEAVDHILFDL